MIHTVLTTLVLLAPAATAVEPNARVAPARQGEIEDLVRERATAAEGLSMAELWKDARSVAVLVGDESGVEFDAAVDKVLEAGSPSSGRPCSPKMST